MTELSAKTDKLVGFSDFISGGLRRKRLRRTINEDAYDATPDKAHFAFVDSDAPFDERDEAISNFAAVCMKMSEGPETRTIAIAIQFSKYADVGG